MAKKKQIIVRASELYDGKGYLRNKRIVIEKDRIVEVRSGKGPAHFEGIVTPAFIDAHSHIGMFRAGEPSSEQEGNDKSHQIRPAHDPIWSVYFDDRTFQEAIDFGVLYSCIIPGSGNLFGGRAKVIRHDARHVAEAEVLDYGFKMALGFNPRSVSDWKGERPNTRMGIYALLERHFDNVLDKERRAAIERDRKLSELSEKSELTKEKRTEQEEQIEEQYVLSLTVEEWTLLDALSGKRTIKVHVHKADDVMYLLHLKKTYGLKVTAEHVGDVHEAHIFKELAKADVPIVYGPLGGFDYKTELFHAYYQNVDLLMKSKAQYGLMSDHPVIHASALRDSLKFFLVFGMESVDAINLITRRNAEILELDQQLGTIEAGKFASLLVWDRDPLHLAAIPKVVLGEGKLLRGKPTRA